MQAGFNHRKGWRMNITKGLVLHHPSAQTIWQATGRLGTHAKLLVARISKKALFRINSNLTQVVEALDSAFFLV